MSEFLLKYWPLLITIVVAIIYIIRQENKLNLVCKENESVKEALKDLKNNIEKSYDEIKRTNIELNKLSNAYARISGFLEGLEASGLDLTVKGIGK